MTTLTLQGNLDDLDHNLFYVYSVKLNMICVSARIKHKYGFYCEIRITEVPLYCSNSTINASNL